MIRDILQSSKNIAILGLSNDSSKPSFMVAQYLVEHGYNVIPIHPKYKEIMGFKVYSNLHDAFCNENIDILNVFRKSEVILDITKEVLGFNNKPKCIWVQLGIESMEAKKLMQNSDIVYIENLCIKIEHEAIFGGKVKE